MKKVDNYIFDFYGTLVDIWTDEHEQRLWHEMAAFYSVYGRDYAPAAFEDRYWSYVREAEAKLGDERGYLYPEIDLTDVFLRLYREAPRTHETFMQISEDRLPEWVAGAANIFRIISRKRLGPFPNTIYTLQQLKDAGKKLWLLSNAQKVFTMPEIEATGLAGFFDKMYISSDYQMRKPQREFMQRLLREQDIDPKNAVMIGNDFSTDMKIAADTGVAGIFLNTDKHSADELIRGKAGLYPAEIELIPSGDIAEILKGI